MDTFTWGIVFFWVGVAFGISYLLACARDYGNGNIRLGIKRYFDLSYEKPEIENARIAAALEDLVRRVRAEEGHCFQVTISVRPYDGRQMYVQSPRSTPGYMKNLNDGTAISWSEDDDRNVFDFFLEDYPRKD